MSLSTFSLPLMQSSMSSESWLRPLILPKANSWIHVNISMKERHCINLPSIRERGSHNLNISSAVKGIMASSICHSNQLLLGSLAIGLGRVDEVCCSKLSAHSFLPGFKLTMIFLAFLWTAPCTTDTPTQPAPKTAMPEPSSISAIWTAAP